MRRVKGRSSHRLQREFSDLRMFVRLDPLRDLKQLPISKAFSPCARRAASKAGCCDGTIRSRRPSLIEVSNAEF
jgi:predicted ATPase